MKAERGAVIAALQFRQAERGPACIHTQDEAAFPEADMKTIADTQATAKAGGYQGARVIAMTECATIPSLFFDPADILRNGHMVLSAEMAGKILKSCRYELQTRDQTAGGKDHIRVLSEIMRSGRWQAKSQIAFARIGGKLVLINGHHRLEAQALSGCDIEWDIVIYDCASMDDVADLYYIFDTNVRVRTVQNILSAGDVQARLGLSKEQARALYRCIPLLQANFDFTRCNRNIVEDRIIDRRIERMAEFAEEARRHDSAIKPAPIALKRKLRSQGAMSVALIAFRHHPDRADDFWRGVAEGADLRKGDARLTYLRMMANDSNGRIETEEHARAAAVAWNAFFLGNKLQIIKIVLKNKFFIAGTPIRSE